jgi:predicted MPP superfamily phosphohydrolase
VSSRNVRIVRALLVVTIVSAPVLGGWAFWWEPRRLLVREVPIALPCWRGEPLRVALAADLHVGSPGTGIEKLDRVVARINEAKPDIVLLLGDYVIQGVIGGQFVAPEAIAEHLRPLKAPLGVYAVLGNHDWWLDGPRVARAFNGVGIPVIEDRAVRIAHHGGGFWLVGISDFWEGRHDVASALSQVTSDEPAMAMTHNPDVFPSVPKRVCLTVAGHAHGGQVACPLIGRPIVPSRKRYAVGDIIENGKRMFVTTGVGTSILPVRFRVPPEIVILRVSSAGQ